LVTSGKPAARSTSPIAEVSFIATSKPEPFGPHINLKLYLSRTPERLFAFFGQLVEVTARGLQKYFSHQVFDCTLTCALASGSLAGEHYMQVQLIAFYV